MQAHWRTAAKRDDHFLELFRTIEFAERAHAHFSLVILQTPGRQLDAIVVENFDQVARGDFVGGHFHRIQPHPNGLALFAAKVDSAHPCDGLQPVFELALGDLGKFECGALVAEQTNPHDFLRIDVLLGNDRLVNVFRHEPAGAGNAVAHVLG